MELLYKYLPTPLAKRISQHVGLLPKDKADEDYQQRLVMLTQFEQLAMTSSYLDSETAWFGIRLTKKQKDHLRIIHKASPAWIRAHTAAKLSLVLDNADKAAVDAAKVIFENMIPEGEKDTVEEGKFIVNLYGKGSVKIESDNDK